MAVEERERPGGPTAAARGRRLGSWSRLPPLIGRTEELAALCARLRDPSVDLVTVVGPGGSGKTRLARAAAAELSAEFPNGVVMVDLAPLWDAADVLPAIAYALDVQDEPNKPIGFTIADHLAGRRTLFILDNFEHVLGASADLAALLDDAPGTTSLVTSRSALRLYGEQEFPLSLLSLPECGSAATPATVAEAASVQLFIRAAQLIRPDFALSDSNAATIAEICVRLDGLPLALELAAARLKVLTPDALLRRLTDGSANPIEILSTGAPNVPARHQTLRGAIAWSYALLTPAEQSLFRRLSAFAGGASLDAIAGVCFGQHEMYGVEEDPLNLIAALVNQSLVRQTEADGEPRFEMLSTIREFAREQVAGDELAALRERHARFFLQFAESMEPIWDRPVPENARDCVEREYDNLRAALSWSVDADQGGDTALRLAGALGWFWKHRGRLREGRSWLAAALESGETDQAARAKALFAAGKLAVAADDYQPSAAYLDEAIGLSRDLGDLDLLARSLNGRACVAANLGDRRQEHESYVECLAIWQEMGSPVGVAKALNGLGETARERGDYVEARRFYEEALTLADDRDPHVACIMLHNLAYVCGQDGDLVGMADFFRRALERSVSYGDDAMTALCLAGLAGASITSGNPERAARLFGGAEALRVRCGGRIDPADRGVYERNLVSTRAAMTDDVFAAIWEEGRGLTLDELLAEVALVDGVAAAPLAERQKSEHRGAAGLTRREREVATLVARGMTNRQIAEALTIAERTVGTHVEHIMAKLDCHSRAQIAAWMTEHGLIAFPDTDPLQVA